MSEYDSESDSWLIVTPQLVCDFSGNNFGFQLVAHLADWLGRRSVKIYALDLSLNRVQSATWDPLLELIDKLCEKVDLLHLGGNYLPALTETHQLQQLQQSHCVSLALPFLGSPASKWQQAWTQVALDFNQMAYDHAEQ